MQDEGAGAIGERADALDIGARVGGTQGIQRIDDRDQTGSIGDVRRHAVRGEPEGAIPVIDGNRDHGGAQPASEIGDVWPRWIAHDNFVTRTDHR